MGTQLTIEILLQQAPKLLVFALECLELVVHRELVEKSLKQM